VNDTLKTIVWITAGAAVVSLGIAVLLFFTGDMAESFKPGNGITVDERKSFGTGGIDRINVQTSSIDVYVTTVDGDTVELWLHGEVYTGQPDAVPALAADKNGELLEISLERKDERKWMLGFFSGDLILEIGIPQSYGGSLKVDTSSGDVEIRDQNLSELSVQTSSGDLRLNSIQASTIAMESSSGDLTGESLNAGHATMSSSSGEIRVRGLRGGVSAESSSGDISLRFGELDGNVEVESSSGDVGLFLTETAAFQVEAKASSGDVDCAYAVTLSGADREIRKNRLSGTVGAGTHRVSVKTSSGDITIRP
jgi:lia operon protein LiaG